MSRLRANRQHWPRRILLAAGIALPCACGHEAATNVVGTSLLDRPPDERIEELGTLVPHPELQWEGRGGSGWTRETRHRADGRPYALGSTIEARLSLPATGPGRRTIHFEAWITVAGDEEERGVGSVHLNDQQIGELRLSNRPRPHTFVVEPELWQPGENQLVFRVPPTVYREPGEFLAVGELSYGQPRLVEQDLSAGVLRLPPGTGVRYRLLPLQDARLLIAGHGSGEAQVSVSILDPMTSRSLATLGPLPARASEGVLRSELPLPPTDGRLVEVELTWSADSAEPLVLERLELLEARERIRPPIVLISIDTLSAHHLSLYGYPRETTPHLDARARNEPAGIVFERCRANAPWTSPSYVSLFTGLYPTSVSMDLGEDDSRFLSKLPEGRLTLAEALRASGYRTAGFVDALHLDERFGFAQGFEHFDFTAGERPLTDPEGGFRHILPRALDWIDSLGEGAPFFLFLHVYEVHGPYLPPPPFAGRFEDDALAKGSRELLSGTLPHTFLGIPDYISSAWPETPIPSSLATAPFLSAYDEGILAMDETLGRLFDALEERGILDEALVIFTGDHGESIDDHDYVGHGLLYEEVLQVPLVIWPPRAWRTEETPRRVMGTVQLADMLPTVLDLVGPPSPRSELHGRSFAPVLFGKPLESVPTFSEGGAMRQAAIELDGWKLIESRPGTDSLPWTMLSNPRLPRAWVREHVPELDGLPLTSANFQRVMQREDADLLALLDALRAELDETVIELYDLTNDPREQVDLSEQRPEKVTELLRHLRRAQARREEARRAVEEALVPLSPADLEELQKLGYVER